MDEIEYKLTSNNPILIAHGMSKVLDKLKDKIKDIHDIDVKIFDIPEWQLLIENCMSDDKMLCSIGCQALYCLVEIGSLNISDTLSKFIGSIHKTKNYSMAIETICKLLILETKMINTTDNYISPYQIMSNHPLIIVLNKYNDSCQDVISQMQSMLHCELKVINNYVELLRPVFMHILCDFHIKYPESCRQQAWRLLLKTHGTIELQIKLLHWITSNDTDACVSISNMTIEMAQVAINGNNVELYMALAPLIMSLALDLLKYNSDPRLNTNMIESILNTINDNYIDNGIGDIMIGLLSEMLTITSTFCLIDIMKIGKLILIKLSCNKIIAHSLVASILPWMAYVTILSVDALDIGKDLINIITKNSYRQNNSNIFLSANHQYGDIIRHANHHYQFYSELCHIFHNINDNDLVMWLEKLSKIPMIYLLNYRLIFNGIFLYSTNLNVIKISGKLLLNIAKKNKNIAGHVLSLLLYKLTNTHEINMTNELLIILPELAVSKENIPIIIRTLETFINAGDPLNYLAINLYLKAWMVEPRCHKYLLTALINMSQNDKTMKGNVTCANAMKFICQHRPEHAAEVAPLLSNTLNRCVDTTGSAASALALGGISALCLSGIADVCSTWKVLSPKMNKEERPIVIKSMCEFFADIPPNSMHIEEEFDKLIDEALSKLWEFARFETTRNIEIVESAFKALSVYPINKMTMSTLPEEFKSNLQLSEKYIKSSTDDEKKIEDALNYIPGICWINMLENIYEPTRLIAGNFIIKLIDDELHYFRSRIYMWSMGEPINYKYLPEKSASRAIGEYLRRYKVPSSLDKQKIAVECLRIFSNKYSKPLPPIKWNLLNDVIKITDDAWNYGISMACHQAASSPSAKEFVSEQLTKMTMQTDEMTDDKFKMSLHLCKHLNDICRGVMSNVLGPFLESITNYIIDNIIEGKENFTTHFEELMIQYSICLDDDLAHDDNKTLIANNLECLLNKLNVKRKIFSSLVKAMVCMPIEQIKRMTLPSVWVKITNKKLKNAIVIRMELALKHNTEICIDWLKEIVQASYSIPDLRNFLLEHMVRIQSHLRCKMSDNSWWYNLQSEISTTLIKSVNDDTAIGHAELLCDILFVTIIILSGTNCLLLNNELLITSDKIRARLFPHAIATITLTIDMKRTTLQIRNVTDWLNSMRECAMSESYQIIFYNALISMKRMERFSKSWVEYSCIKSPINL